MGTLETLKLLARIVAWRARWTRRELDHVPGGPGPFMTGRDAALSIPDGATVISCGMAGNARCTALFWAVREAFEQSRRPAGLTWISVGAQGGRGKAPGTVEELALPGLLRCYISGHVETAKALLALADDGELDVHVLPQGEMTLLVEGQATGVKTVESGTGVGTFLDPRVGPGSALVASQSEPLIEAAGERLKYRLPPIDVALFSAAAADSQGNVYLHDMATLTETFEAVRAAKHNGGRVIAVVASVIDGPPAANGHSTPMIAADQVDGIVVNRFNEQTVMVPQSAPWPLFQPGGDGDDHAAIERLRTINRLLHITPSRGQADLALGRLGAQLFSEVVPRGAHINIGVGLPEEVCREVYESGLHGDLVFTTETGVYGGLPAPGIYFGAAVNPLRFESSAWMFRHYRERLDAAVLGILEVDSDGNVNVSRRGAGARDYVGPGGFPTIVDCADTVIFVGAWMSRARWRVRGSRLELLRAGRPKFVGRVREITFNGPRALAMGKRVYYVTHVGVFQLTENGLELVRLMPGIDPQRDVLAHSGARIHLADDLGEADASVVTGSGFSLRFANTMAAR